MKANSSVVPADLSWDGPRTLVLAFFAPELALRPAPLELLRRAFPQSYLLGCSTAGEIVGTTLEDHSVAVAVVNFASTDLCMARTQIANAAFSGDAGTDLGRSLSRPDLKGVFVLSDGLNINGTELARGFNEALPPHVSVTGGLAGDGERFGTTYTFAAGPGEPLNTNSGQVGALGFCGDAIRISSSSKGGWSPFGLERKVTRSTGNVLYELDGKPALELYKTYLGDRAQGLPATALLFPLTIRDKQAFGPDALVRTILAVDENAQSLIFAGDIPQGAVVQLMRCSLDRLVEGAANAAENLSETGKGPALSIAITCVGRRLVLGERTEEELEAVLDTLPAGTQQVGFYSYGELSPVAVGQCHLHNQTMTLTLVQED